jgi:hypothetical protein
MGKYIKCKECDGKKLIYRWDCVREISWLFSCDACCGTGKALNPAYEKEQQYKDSIKRLQEQIKALKAENALLKTRADQDLDSLRAAVEADLWEWEANGDLLVKPEKKPAQTDSDMFCVKVFAPHIAFIVRDVRKKRK